MNLKNPTLLLAMLALSCPTFAQSYVNIYGILDVSAEYLHFEDVSGHPSRHLNTLTSDTSRLGFRGSEDLGDSLRAYFKLENGFQVDTGAQTSATAFFNRESYVGLGSTTFGYVQLGSQFAPSLFMSTKVDPFQRFGIGGQYTLLQGIRGYQNRYDNTIQYISPTLAGITGKLLASAGEGAVTGASYSGSAEYAVGPLYFGAVYDQVKATAASVGLRGNPMVSRTLSVAGTYDFKLAKLAGWYQTNRIAGLSNVNGYMVGATVPVGLAEIRTSYSHRIQANASASLASIGYFYHLSKRTQVYTTIGRLVNSGSAAYRLGPATSEQATAGLPFAGQELSGAQLGIRHYF